MRVCKPHYQITPHVLLMASLISLGCHLLAIFIWKNISKETPQITSSVLSISFIDLKPHSSSSAAALRSFTAKTKSALAKAKTPTSSTTHDDRRVIKLNSDQIQKPATPKGVSKVPIPYPDFAVDLGVEGSIVLILEITQDGKVKNASVKKKLGFGLDEFVLEKVRQFEFEPALNFQGQPVASIFEHEVRFELD